MAFGYIQIEKKTGFNEKIWQCLPYKIQVASVQNRLFQAQAFEKKTSVYAHSIAFRILEYS